jgi:GntR family transcriptional regulator, transcriptional repressor for pyruvate dehydrogenase complex
MFKSVRTNRSSQVIVDQIKDAIFQKKVRPGDKLPSERQLMEQFQACRVTVREALKLLEYAGILEIKRGTQGGAYVRDPNIKFINNFLRDMFSMGNINVADLTEARIAVEPFTLRLAAERMSEECLEQLKQNIDETKECLKRKNPNDARLLNLEFHRIIAQASGNLVIFFMIDSIMDIMENNISSSAFGLSTKAVERTLHFHEEIYQTIKDRSPEKAQELMLKHVREIERALETKELPVSGPVRRKPKKH